MTSISCETLSRVSKFSQGLYSHVGMLGEKACTRTPSALTGVTKLPLNMAVPALPPSINMGEFLFSRMQVELLGFKTLFVRMCMKCILLWF